MKSEHTVAIRVPSKTIEALDALTKAIGFPQRNEAIRWLLARHAEAACPEWAANVDEAIAAVHESGANIVRGDLDNPPLTLVLPPALTDALWTLANGGENESETFRRLLVTSPEA